MIKTQEDFFKNILPLTLLQGFERVVKGLHVRGNWRSNITELFWPCCYDRHVVSFLFSWCSTGGLGPTAGCWLSLLHLISIFSGPQTPSGYPRAPSVGCGFPNHISSLAVWNSTGNYSGSSNSAELYNRSTPTRSLKSNVYSSSSGNNCHAVHRSLSSGASVYECIMGFTLSHFISQFPHRRFPLLTAIRMCHFLPVHQLKLHFWPCQKVKT